MTKSMPAKASDKPTYEQRRVLRRLNKSPATPKECKTGIRTFQALERRGWIRVDTTFDSIVFPRTARAVITDAGRKALNAGGR